MKPKIKLRQAVDTIFLRGPATIDTYTQLLLNCIRANDAEQAKRLESHMDLYHFRPKDTFFYNRLVRLYAKCGKLLDAQQMFDKMPKRDNISWNSMLSAYANLDSLENMQAFFDRMPFLDSVSYNTLIAGLAGRGFSSKALEVFVEMHTEGIEPTEYTHAIALSVCSRLLNLRFGKQIHGRIVTSNFAENGFVCNALTDTYAKCGEIDLATRLFDRNKNKNLVSWNSMISGFLKNGHQERCIDLFHKMQLVGMEPDEITLSNILQAYFHKGFIDEASRVFGEIKQKDMVCWTTMIAGYATNGREEDALLLFCQMLSDDIKPDSFTISSVVGSCAKLTSLPQGQVVHGKAVHLGVDVNLLVSTALVDMYCKCGVTADAEIVFNMMSLRNVVSWNSMIRGYAQNGQDLKALALYEKMLQEKFKPDSLTFVAVLSACNNAGLVEEGQKYFDSISKLHAVTPTSDHYACLISLLGRSGNIEKAIYLIKSMPYEPDSLIWSTLLSVSARIRDIKHSEMAARFLFDLQPLDAGPYIMLSNIYASYGRWDDVASVRSLMKHKNVKKSAAYSWIEIDNEIHKFVSEDRTHPDTEMIYEELNTLIKKLQGAGFSPDTKIVLHDVVEEEKIKSICYHSEKLALAFALVRKPHARTPIRIMKNLRACCDCHMFMKFVSKIINRHIILRDSKRFHHFIQGKCSCKDYW